MSEQTVSVHASTLVAGDEFYLEGKHWQVTTGNHGSVDSIAAKPAFKIWVKEMDAPGTIACEQGWLHYDSHTMVDKIEVFMPGSMWIYYSGSYEIRRQDNNQLIFDWAELRNALQRDQAHLVHQMLGVLVDRHNREVT